MGRGREVAEAFIDVHGDLSNFRRDLEGANADMEALAIETADTFSDAWGDRMAKQLDKQWNSVIDSVFSGSDTDISKMIGSFDSTDLDAATEKIHLLLRDMREAGKMTGDEYDQVMGKIEAVAKAQRQAFFQEQDDMAERTRSMFELAQVQERYAKSFEAMVRGNRMDDLTADFKAMAKAASDMNWSKMAAGFENMDAFRDRIAEVNSEMMLLGRISEDNAKRISSDVDAWIAQEQERKRVLLETAAAAEESLKTERALKEQNRTLTAQATADAIKAAKELRDEQDRYNKSLEGMTKLAKIRLIERDYRMLTEAIASSDWSQIAKGSHSLEEMRERTTRVMIEMHRMGRITDEEFSKIGRSLNEVTRNLKDFNVEFKKTNSVLGDFAEKNAGKSLRAFGSFLTSAGHATNGLRLHLQGLAGLNVFGDMIRSGLDFIHNLDRIALSAAQTSLQLGLMSAAAGSALAGVTVLAADVVESVFGLSALLPAFLTGAGIGIGVLVASFKDLKTVLKDLGPAWSKLQDTISEQFWSAAEQPIRNLNEKLFPTLQFQLGITANMMGTLVGVFANAFADAATPERVTAMFERMNTALETVRGAIAPLVRAFVNLGDVGSKYFDRFAKWTVKLAEQFDKFIQNAFDTGEIDKWIETGITGFKNMGRSLDGMIGIFNAIDSAARAAGTGGLSEFADKLQGAAAIMQSPKFQESMTRLFSGMNTMIRRVGEALYDLGPALASIMPEIEVAFGNLGTAAALVIGYIGEVLENPAVQASITSFTGNIVTALEKLAPAIKPFADSLGGAVDMLGKILVGVAEVAAAFVIHVGPVLDSMSAKMSTLIEPLKNSAVKFIQEMEGPLRTLDEKFVGPVTTAIREKLLPAIDGFIEKFGPFAEKVITDLAPVFKILVEETLPNLIKFAGELLDPLGKVVDLLSPTLATTVQKIADAFGNLADDIKVFKGELPVTELTVFKAFDPETVKRQGEEMRQSIKDNLSGRGNTASWSEIISDAFWGQAPDVFWAKVYSKLGPSDEGGKKWDESVGKWLEGMRSGFVDLVNGSREPGGINEVVNNWMKDNIVKPWEDGIASIAKGNFGSSDEGADKWNEFVSRPIQQFKDAMGSVDDEGGLNDTVNKWFDDTIFKPIREGWDSAMKSLDEWWDGVKRGFQEWMSGLLGFDTIFEDDASVSTGGGGAGGRGMGIGGKIEEAWQMEDMSFMDKFKEAVRIKWEEFWAGVQEQLGTWGETIKTGWNDFWTGIGAKVQEVWDGALLWIQTKATEIGTTISTWAAGVKTGWDTFWADVNKKVQDTWNEVTAWIATKAGEIRTNVENFIRDTKANWDNFWAGVSAKVTEIWNSITSWINAKAGEIRSNIESFGRDVKANWDNFWAEVGRRVDDAWRGIQSGVDKGIQDVLKFFRDLPGNIVSAVGDLWSLLSGHGKQIMDGFLGGLQNSWKGVQDFVGGIAQWIADNKGPISYDRVLLTPAGKAIMEGLATGLKGELGSLKRDLETITSVLVDTMTDGFARSQMYLAGAEAALGLADGLASNKALVSDAFGSLLPGDPTVSMVATSGSTTSAAAPGKVINIETLNMPVNTPTKDPEIVTAKVLDGFASLSNF